MRMTGADSGRRGAWVVTSCAASESSSGVVVSTTAFMPGRSCGRGGPCGGRMIRSVIGSLRASTGPGGGRQRDGTAHPGRTGAAQDVIVQLRAEVSHSARQLEGR